MIADTNYLISQLTRQPAAVELFAYWPLTFPRLYPRLQTIHIDSHMIAVEARNGDEVIGLTLAEKSPTGETAQVLSIFAGKRYRGLGVGSRMLRCLEDVLRDQGVGQVHLQYQDNIPYAGAVERIAERGGWSSPEIHRMMVKGTVSAMREHGLEWAFREYPLTDGFEIFPWPELGTDERAAIIKRQNDGPWYPEILSPFREESIMEPLNSLGLRYRGEVIGWMVNHRIGPDTIRYTPLFVSEEARNSRAGYVLIVEAMRRQINSDVPIFLFLFEPNSPIRKWALRHFGGGATMNKIMKTSKNLDAG